MDWYKINKFKSKICIFFCLLDLCVLYMSLSKYSNKTFVESDQALYSSYLKFLIEKVVLYNDLDSNKSTIRKDLFEFFHIEIEQLKFVAQIKLIFANNLFSTV